MSKIILALCFIAIIVCADKVPLTRVKLSKDALERKRDYLKTPEFTAAMIDALRPNSEKLLPIKDYTDTQYLAEMRLGESEESFMIVPDTGSSNIWTYSAKCYLSIPCWLHNTYHEGKSWEKDGRKFTLNYGSGGVSGFLSKDTVNFGTQKVEHFTFGEVDSASGMAFIVGKMDGILGLGYDSISIEGLPVFFDQIADSDHSFSFFMSHVDKPSYMVIPGTDADLYHGQLTYHDVIEQRYWSLKLTDLTVAGKSVGDASKYKAVIDSGTSLIVGDSKIVDPIIAAIGEIDQTCVDNSHLPEFEIEIDGISYKLLPEDYVVEVDTFLGKACLLGIMASEFPEGFDYLIVGDVFMRKYYTHFDKNNNKVGMALANHD